MRYFYLLFTAALMAITLGALPATAAPPVTDEAERLFKAYDGAVYQVEVIDLASNRKTSIGSGFQFTPDGLIATNYHVVAEAIQHPEGNRVEFIHGNDAKGHLKIVLADVVHDLAIVKMDHPGKTWLKLGSSNLPKGATLFSLGNPHDIGFTIIGGIYNGLSKESFIDKIHFSGSLNPGMSGGPAIGHDGQVVGVNVSTAGNQISFLVPVEPLRQLYAEDLRLPKSYDFLGHADEYIQNQLLKIQDYSTKELLKKGWESVPFGPVMVPGRIHDVLKCWGGINHKEKDPYHYYFSMCSSQDRMFLDTDFDTSVILYRYDYLEGKDTLNLERFYNFYQQQFATPLGDFQNAKEGDVGNFDCNSRFVGTAGLRWKSNFCVRQYRKYPKIFDLHLNMALVGAGKKGFIATLTVQGVSRKNALALAKKFMEGIKPRPAGQKEGVPRETRP